MSSSTAVPNQAPTQKPPPPPSHPAPAASRLDGRQTIVSFIPQASSSSYTPDPPPAPVPTPKVLKKKQKTPPITNDQATIDFLRTELGAAQARIVILDASIVDKDKELSVLWARVQILEEKQNKDLLDKYFPHKTPQPAAPKTSASSSPCSSSGCTSSPMPCSYCHHHPTLFSCCSRSSATNNTGCSTQPNPQASDHSPDLYRKVLEVCQEVKELKSYLFSQKTNNPKQDTPSGPPPNIPTSNINENAGSQPENDHPHVSVSSNDSRASAEEFIPDLPENEDQQDHLNWNLQTNQL